MILTAIVTWEFDINLAISVLMPKKKLTCEDWICCAIAFYKISLHQQDRQQIKTRWAIYTAIAKGKTSTLNEKFK